MSETDVVIVGTGPNALAAGVVAARAGLRVEMFERNHVLGGGARTAELTLPGFSHDVCSAVHPMAFASPFFQAFELDRRIELRVPEISYAHPLDGAQAGLGFHDLDAAADSLGGDGRAWRALMSPLVDHLDDVMSFTSDNLLRVPRHPVAALRYALRTLEQGSPAWNLRFRDQLAPAMLGGLNAHAIGRMPRLATAGAGLLLGAQAHARGWPIPVGGTQRIADAMADDIRAHGGTIHVDHEVTSLAELPRAGATILDVTPRALLALAGNALPSRYARAIGRFRYGNGVSKVDFALSGPVPWSNEGVRRAGTVHVVGTRAEAARAEAQVAAGRHPDRPYVLLAQPSGLDDSRAPAGKHVLWTYAHVPSGSTVDMTEAITAQIERFAPGFRDVIEASASRTAEQLEDYNPNYIGGDISAGAVTLFQLLKRPVVSTDPWKTPIDGVYLCSSSTPPGPAVHGLCGMYAAASALRREFGITELPSLGM